MPKNYSFKYTNGFANYGKIESNELEINGDCKITNYNPKTKDGKSKGEITIDFSEGNETIKNGTNSGYIVTEKANFSNKKYSIFKEIAKLDGNTNELSINDIKQMKKSLIKEWGLKDLRFDYNNGVATLIWGEDDILRIDFSNKKPIAETSSKKQIESTKKTPSSNNMTKNENNSKDTKAFLEALGAQETRGKKNPYFCKNKAGYVGKYQMGEEAMSTMGIYTKKNKNYNNDWTGTFRKNKYGITSLWDFRKSPEKQEQLQIDYKKKDWQYIKNKGLLKYLNKTINGVVITESGLLAGAHLVGAGGLSKYLKSNGTIDVADGTGTPVSQYIKQFAGYDVSEITTL